MPAIVGPFKINTVTGAGVTFFGDTFQITPKNTSKSYGGQGSFNTGDFHLYNNGFSITNTPDPDLSDDSNVGNN